ncbi:MAG: hypothetical protein RJA87_1846 [Pseudomonadota bacterium]
MEPFALRTILPLRPVLTLGAFLTFALRPIPLRTIPLRTITLGTVTLGTVTLLEALTLLARFAVAVAAKVAVTITARLVLATLPALVLTRIMTSLLLTRLWSLVLARLLVADFGLLRLCRIVAVLIFEIDIEARRNRITSENFSRRTVRLNRPQEPEIVLGMLQIVFGQNPVTRRRRVTGQLLVLFEDVLRMAANLDPIRAVGFEGSVGVLLRLTTAAGIATAGPTAATLPLHSFEISHILSVTWFAGTPKRPRGTL